MTLFGRDDETGPSARAVTACGTGPGERCCRGGAGRGQSALLRAGLAAAARPVHAVVGHGRRRRDRSFPLPARSAALRVPAAMNPRPWSTVVWSTGQGVLAGDPCGSDRGAALVAVQMCAVTPVLLVAENLHCFGGRGHGHGLAPLEPGGWARCACCWRARCVRDRGEATSTGCAVVSRSSWQRAHPGVAQLGSHRRAGARRAGGRQARRLASVLGAAGGNPLYARELASALVREGRVRVGEGMAELAERRRCRGAGVADAVLMQRLCGCRNDVVDVLARAALLGRGSSRSLTWRS